MPITEIKPVKLNLGCGGKHFKGFINIDRAVNYSNDKPDIEADVRKLPFPDNHADEIHAIHVIEHFYRWEVDDILKEWNRVLKPGGIMFLELPDLQKILYYFFNFFISGQKGMAKTWWGLYGDPMHKDPDMVHKWAYSFAMIKDLLETAGFRDVKRREALFHMPKRDMRIECCK